jgi:hypothetical protein
MTPQERQDAIRRGLENHAKVAAMLNDISKLLNEWAIELTHFLRHEVRLQVTHDYEMTIEYCVTRRLGRIALLGTSPEVGFGWPVTLVFNNRSLRAENICEFESALTELFSDSATGKVIAHVVGIGRSR